MSVLFHNYSAISKCFTYPELCLLEHAISKYEFPYKVDEKQLADLRHMVTLARGWAHHVGKCER